MQTNKPEVKSFGDYRDRDYLIVIPSKGRGRHIEQLPGLFPNGVIYVNETELKDYSESGLPLIPHRITNGYGAVINGILRGCAEAGIRYACVFDDDSNQFVSFVGNKPRRLDAIQTETIIANDCQIMEDTGCRMICFSTAHHPLEYTQSVPYKIGCFIPQGAFIVRTDCGITFTEHLIESTDLDFVLKLCRKHRYMIQDHRFVCVKKSAHQEGGCNAQRTEADRLASRQYLLNTWGRYISYRPNRHGKINPQITVKYRH